MHKFKKKILFHMKTTKQLPVKRWQVIISCKTNLIFQKDEFLLLPRSLLPLFVRCRFLQTPFLIHPLWWIICTVGHRSGRLAAMTSAKHIWSSALHPSCECAVWPSLWLRGKLNMRVHVSGPFSPWWQAHLLHLPKQMVGWFVIVTF